MTEIFCIQTCEAKALGEPALPFAPGANETEALFSIQDPFGLRRAIFPVFGFEADGHLQGLGTAFSLDPWGNIVTAEHVMAEYLKRNSRDECEALGILLGMGLVYGQVGIPEDCWALVRGAWSPAIEIDNPMAELRGEDRRVALDLCLSPTRLHNTDVFKTLPLRKRPPLPKVGERVIAFGYPQIETLRGSEEQVRSIISEGMSAAVGAVTEIYPHGRDRAHPTPVFEVDATWPGGMSGGPVFNTAGEVVGLVSRSLLPDGDQATGQGWATALNLLSEALAMPRTLDENPDWRRGWASLRDDPWHLAGVHQDQTSAMTSVQDRGDNYKAVEGRWRIGSDDFLSTSFEA